MVIVSSGQHANLIIQWEHWVTVHQLLLLLICQLLLTPSYYHWVCWPHLLPQSYDVNLLLGPPGILPQSECHHLRTHLEVWLVQFSQQSLRQFLRHRFNSPVRVPFLQVVAVAWVMAVSLSSNLHHINICHNVSSGSNFMNPVVFVVVICARGNIAHSYLFYLCRHGSIFESGMITHLFIWFLCGQPFLLE